MAQVPLVSVVMPNRDHARYLPTALDALVRQTWRNIELIVVDDASSDTSRDIVNACAARDARVQLLPLASHCGIARSIEHGLRRASGEFIYIPAADDFVAPTFVQKSVEQLIKASWAGLCFSDPAEFVESPDRATFFPLYLSKTPAAFDSDTLISLLNNCYFNISTNTILYRRSAFVGAGGYMAEIEWQADVFVSMVVALRHGACYIPEHLAFLRIRPDSYSAVSLRNAEGQRDLVYRILALLGEPAYADVRERFRAIAFLPEYRIRTLYWLLRRPIGRKFLNARLLWKVLSRMLWSYLRPVTPVFVRRGVRALASR